MDWAEQRVRDLDALAREGAQFDLGAAGHIDVHTLDNETVYLAFERHGDMIAIEMPAEIAIKLAAALNGIVEGINR